MSSGNIWQRIFALEASVKELVHEGKRTPEWYAEHLQVMNDEKVEKFALLADLGVVTVPEDYDHATALATFGKQNGKKLAYYNPAITDQNFSDPTRILKPGDKLRVCAFKQTVNGTTTSEERMNFLRRQGAIFVGAQGASLVFDQKRDQLPKGLWYASFDEKDRLWTDADGCHGVPCVYAFSHGDFDFGLGYFEDVWYDSDSFLCFRDLNES